MPKQEQQLFACWHAINHRVPTRLRCIPAMPTTVMILSYTTPKSKNSSAPMLSKSQRSPKLSLRDLSPILHHIYLLNYGLPEHPEGLQDTADLLHKGACKAFVSNSGWKTAWEGAQYVDELRGIDRASFQYSEFGKHQAEAVLDV